MFIKNAWQAPSSVLFGSPPPSRRKPCIKTNQLSIKLHVFHFLERDKVQRQFKIFRESKEREIQDVLKAKRELEVQFHHYLSVSSRNESRSEVVNNLAADWWASSVESDPSVTDSLTQVMPFRGPEFCHSPVEREGPFTNISRGITC